MTPKIKQVFKFISDLSTEIQEVCGWGVPINKVFTLSEKDFKDLEENHTEEELEDYMFEADRLQEDLSILQEQLEQFDKQIWKIIRIRRLIEIKNKK
jgi:hypothetical protein